MTSKSDSIGMTCTRLRHFADTFSQWNSCWKKLTLRHMTENKCGYQMHIFVTSFSAQHASAWRCFCMVQPLRQPFRPKCTNRILQMHHQNPVVPPESDVHPQNPVCTYSVWLGSRSFLRGNMEVPVSIFQESPLAGEPRERLFHIHSVHRYQLCAKYLYPSTLLWQINCCNL